jgi:hypothetical protein
MAAVMAQETAQYRQRVAAALAALRALVLAMAAAEARA